MSDSEDSNHDADRTFTLDELQGNEKALMNGALESSIASEGATGQDYSTRLQEILGLENEDDNDEQHAPLGDYRRSVDDLDDEDDDEEEEFLYSGVDAAPEPVGYDAQLAALLDGAESVKESDEHIIIGDEPLEYGKYKVCVESNLPTLYKRAHNTLG